MPWKFNPFSVTLDQTGSGGGGAQYLDGEVATYNDLSLDAGVAALNTAWLVREASGTWLIGRKPAGIYIRTATAGVSRDADYAYAGIFPDVFSDANFTLYDDGDATKTAQFQLSGITTGTNRTLTVPDASGTLPLLETANTFSANQTLDGTNNVAPNQTAASGSSVMTRDLVDARIPIYLTLRPENNQTAADAANFYSAAAVTLPLDYVPAKIEIHAELEFTTTPLAAGVSNFRFRLAIRDVEGASMNVTSSTSVFNADSVTNVTGDRYIIKGQMTSFPATWSTRLATHGTIFLVTDGTVFNYTGGSLTLVNNQDRRVGYRIFR